MNLKYKKQKAQISLEILIILAILIIGAVVLGIILISNINKAQDQNGQDSVNKIVDDFKNDYEEYTSSAPKIIIDNEFEISQKYIA